mgnify:CR=1 FL=1
MVSVSMDPDRTDYVAGHFERVASELCGEWLGIAFVVGALFANVGIYNAQMVVCERSLSASLVTYVLCPCSACARLPSLCAGVCMRASVSLALARALSRARTRRISLDLLSPPFHTHTCTHAHTLSPRCKVYGLVSGSGAERPGAGVPAV